MSTIPDFTGRFLDNGRYHLLKEIGSGSYGVVYQALDLTSSESIAHSPLRAIKIISKKGLTKRQVVYLTREYNIHLAMGKHPNIATLIRGFEDKDFAYYVLDYCPGGDLFGKACKDGLYWRNDALLKKVFLQIIDAVEACHARGVSHRDLKPENILTNEDGSAAYVTDFGLSTNQATTDGHGCGSSPYMSPECIGSECENKPYSSAPSDIWSLGVTLIILSTGRLPWAKAISSDPNFHQYTLDPNFLRKILPISKGANNIITRMLDSHPEKRITLPELRSAITNLDTFFMSRGEVVYSTASVQAVARHNTRRAKKSQAPERKGAGRRRVLPKLAMNKFRIQRVGSRGQIVDMDMGQGIPSKLGEIIGDVCPPSESLSLPPPPPPPPSRIPKAIRPTKAISIDSASLSLPEFFGTSSGDEAPAPVTPETFAVNPDVEVSELVDDMGVAALPKELEGDKRNPLRVVNQSGPLVSV